MNSKAYSLNITDLVNLGKNAALVGVAAGLTFLVQNIGNVDLGSTGTLLVPIVVVGIDTLIKWIKDNS